MRKLTIAPILAAFLLGLAACGTTSTDTPAAAPTTTPTAQTATTAPAVTNTTDTGGALTHTERADLARRMNAYVAKYRTELTVLAGDKVAEIDKVWTVDNVDDNAVTASPPMSAADGATFAAFYGQTFKVNGHDALTFVAETNALNKAFTDALAN